MFGRRKRGAEDDVVTDLPDEDIHDEDIDDESPGDDTGPHDIADVEDRLDAIAEQRLDLGSVLLPIPDGTQLQVEMAPDGTPQAVHLATEHGRVTVAAYAAPKSPGQWRSVTADLADSLRADNARISIENGPWGRELVAATQAADLRFIGVDGYRWMVRLVAAGPTGSVAEGAPLVQTARAILEKTVVRRGDEPHPVRTPLPVVLPAELTEQLLAAQQQQQQSPQVDQDASPPDTAQPKPPRRGADGSAMQQLRR